MATNYELISSQLYGRIYIIFGNIQVVRVAVRAHVAVTNLEEF